MSKVLKIREIKKQLDNDNLTDQERTKLQAKLIALSEPKGIGTFILVFGGLVALVMLLGIYAMR